MGISKNIGNILFVLLFVISFSTPQVSYSSDRYDNTEVYDPIEGVNRSIYSFNEFLDKILLKPIAKGYRYIVPHPVRKGVHSFLGNLKEPVTLINSAFQGDVHNGFTSFWRFTVNSTFGVAGIFDVAAVAGLEKREEDFGQTAGVYGLGPGAYLMLPILGPSNARDLFGKVVDGFTDPFNYALHEDASLGRALAGGVDSRERTLDLIEEINRTSLDPYAAIRSLYDQKRIDEIKNGKVRKGAKAL